MADPNRQGSFGSTIDWTDFDTEVEAGDTGSYSFRIEVGDQGLSPGDNLDVFISTFLYVAGESDNSIVSSASTEATEGDTVSGSLSHQFPTNQEVQNTVERAQRLEGTSFADDFDTDRAQFGEDEEPSGQYNRSDYPVWAKAEIRYSNSGGDPDEVINTLGSDQSSNTNLPVITRPTADNENVTFGDPQAEGESTLASAFEDEVTFAIRSIEFEEDADFQTGTQIVIEEFPNPTVAIDGAGRFAKHEIIGGATVRQKIGEDPLNISVNGVCNARTANKIDALRDAKSGRMFSTRLPGSTDENGENENGGSLLVQFGSTSTEPITDGGAADLTTGNLLYTYSINAIEVIR